MGKSGPDFERLQLRRSSTKSMALADLLHLFNKIDSSDMWRLKLAHHLVEHDIPWPWPALLNRLVVAHKHRAVTPDLHSPSTGQIDEEQYAAYLQQAIAGVISETLRFKAKPQNMESEENAELEEALGMRGLTKDTKLLILITNKVATTTQTTWRDATVRNLVRRPLFTAKDADANDKQRAKEITVNPWGKGPDGAATPPTITLKDVKTTYAVEWTDEQGNPSTPPLPGDYVLSNVLSYSAVGADAPISLNRQAVEADTSGTTSVVCVAMASSNDKMKKILPGLTRSTSRSNLTAVASSVSQLSGASSSSADKTRGCFKNPLEHFLEAEMVGARGKRYQFSRAQLAKGEVLMLPRENEKVNSGPGALLREAAATGNTVVIEALIGKKIEGPNVKITGEMLVSPFEADEQGTLAVHEAAENGHVDAFRLLEKLGGVQKQPVNAFLLRDKKGKRALDHIMENGHVDLARIGRPAQSDLEMKDVELNDPEALRWSDRVLKLEDGVLEHMNTMPNLGTSPARRASAKMGLLAGDPPLVARQESAPAPVLQKVPEGEGRSARGPLTGGGNDVDEDGAGGEGQRTPSRGRGSPASERASSYMESSTAGACVIKPPYTRQLTAPEQEQLKRLARKVSKCKGVTSLMLACRLPRRADALFAVSALLHAGADAAAATEAGCTALTIAAEMGYDAVCELLIKASAVVDARLKDGKTALMLACKNGYDKVAKVLLDEGFDIADHERQKENGTKDFADPEKTEPADGFTPLMHAAMLGKHECVDVLIKFHYKEAHRARDSSEQYDTGGAEYEIMADTNKDGNTALIMAAMFGQRRVVQTLLREGAKVDTKNNKGETALHCAARNGHAQVVCALLTGGADVDLADENGFTALHHCCITSGGETVVDALLEVGAKVDAQAEMRGGTNTALHFACMAGNHRMVDALLRHKADVSLRNADGKVPFTLAKMAGHDNVMYKLQPVATSLTAHYPAIDTLETFSEARKFVVEYGLQRLKREMVAPGWVDKRTGELTTTYSPFNVWALAGAGLDVKIPGMDDDEHEAFMKKIEAANDKMDAASQAVLKRRQDECNRGGPSSAADARPPIDPEFSQRFMVRLNQPSQDEIWASSRDGSMSKRHRFLIIKKTDPKRRAALREGSLLQDQLDEQDSWLDYNWTWFNVLSFGMRDVDPGSQLAEPEEILKLEADPEENRAHLRRALNQLVDMRDAAYAWVREAARDAAPGSAEHGWTQDRFGKPHLDDLAVDRCTNEKVPGSLKWVGLYFNCYPLVQINSLHLHIVDEYGGQVPNGNLSPAFQEQKKRLLHIDIVIGALRKEIDMIGALRKEIDSDKGDGGA